MDTVASAGDGLEDHIVHHCDWRRDLDSGLGPLDKDSETSAIHM
jgi:hypothetical protein